MYNCAWLDWFVAYFIIFFFISLWLWFIEPECCKITNSSKLLFTQRCEMQAGNSDNQTHRKGNLAILKATVFTINPLWRSTAWLMVYKLRCSMVVGHKVFKVSYFDIHFQTLSSTESSNEAIPTYGLIPYNSAGCRENCEHMTWNN